MSEFIQANLAKTITFTKDGQEIVVPVDSIIMVNVQEGYAYWHTIRFDVFKDEYSLSS